MEIKKMQSVAKGEVEKHEARMHGKGDKVNSYAKGGVTSSNMKKYGRNMARVMNQRVSSRSR